MNRPAVVRFRMGATVMGIVALALAGCAREMSMTGQTARVIESASPSQVLTAAVSLLRQEFGRVKPGPGPDALVTEPVEYDTSRESGTARDLYRGRSTMRRTAQFSVAPDGDRTVARLRIDIERQDAGRAAGAQPAAAGYADSSPRTPIERDAATTARQNAVWTFVRRDYQMERQLLDDLQNKFALPLPATEPAAGAAK